MKLNHHALTAVSAVVLLTMGLFADATADPLPRGVTIGEFQWSGTGCPSTGREVRLRLGSEEGYLAVLFPDTFRVEVGAGIRADRKNCLIILNLNFPWGYQYSLSSLRQFGALNLRGGVNGRINEYYTFQGQSIRATASEEWMRPISLPPESLLFTGQFDPLVWSPCDAVSPLQLNIVAALNNFDDGPNRAGSIQAVQSIYNVGWRRCGTR